MLSSVGLASNHVLISTLKQLIYQILSVYLVELLNHSEICIPHRRTNNFSEESNNALNTAAGFSSPTISRLLGILCRFNVGVDLKIFKTFTSIQATRKPRNKVVKRNERDKKTVKEYSLSKIARYCRYPGDLSEWHWSLMLSMFLFINFFYTRGKLLTY